MTRNTQSPISTRIPAAPGNVPLRATLVVVLILGPLAAFANPAVAADDCNPLVNLDVVNSCPGSAIAISAGTWHTCVLFATGNVDCWGTNYIGQPVDYAADYTGKDAVAVSAGGQHTCVLLATGNVKCWGQTVQDPYRAQTVQDPFNSGGAIAVSSGNSHTCVLLAAGLLRDSGEIECWDNFSGARLPTGFFAGTGLVGISAISAGDDHTCALVEGNVFCWGLNGDQLPGYTGMDAVAVSAGYKRTCVLRASTQVKCWGLDYGQQALDGQSNVLDVTTGHGTTCAVFLGWVECVGNLDHYYYNNQMNGFPVDVAVGHDHTCVLLSTGNVQCQGTNFYGQLVQDNRGLDVTRSPGWCMIYWDQCWVYV